jgi:hypothetical protein
MTNEQAIENNEKLADVVREALAAGSDMPFCCGFVHGDSIIHVTVEASPLSDFAEDGED